MVIEATLRVAGGEFPVTEISYGFNRDIDFHGQPKGNVVGGVINVTVRCEGENSEQSLTDWMLDAYKQESGSIAFSGIGKKSVQKVDFEEAFCVGYNEKFDNTPGEDGFYTTSLVISAKKIKVGDVELDNEWAK